jgi:hypothetical protein
MIVATPLACLRTDDQAKFSLNADHCMLVKLPSSYSVDGYGRQLSPPRRGRI